MLSNSSVFGNIRISGGGGLAQEAEVLWSNTAPGHLKKFLGGSSLISFWTMKLVSARAWTMAGTWMIRRMKNEPGTNISV